MNEMPRIARRTRLQELDPDDALEGLTSKQQLFVMHSFSGLNDTEAYRQAFGIEDAPASTIATRVQATAKHPLVQAKLRELQSKRDQQTTLAPLLSKQMIFDGIQTLALTADKDSTRLRAYELLGKTKLYNIFTTEEEPANKPRSTEDIDRLLKDYLDKLHPMIEGEARRTINQDQGDSAKAGLVNHDPVNEGAKPGDRRRKPAR